MRKLRCTLMMIVAFLGIFPALLAAPTGAQASCHLLGDGYSGDYYTVASECDTYDECTEWLDFIATGSDPDVAWELTCSVAESTADESNNPLGGIPTIAVPQPVQVVRLERACYGESCNGVDPEGTRCLEDARTIYREDVVINSEWSMIKGSGPWGNAEMRYSPTCHANWVRYTPYVHPDDFFRGILSQIAKASDGADGSVSVIDDSEGFGTYYGVPYIWRLGVDNSLYGPTGSAMGLLQDTVWTSMVSADGQTCWSVEIHWQADHHAGAGERDHLGTDDFACVK